MRILLVEDNSADVELIRLALREYEVEGDLEVLADGEQAMIFMDQVDSGDRLRPDLVVLDLNLPKRPGVEVLRRIREKGIGADMTVAVLSSSNAAKDRQQIASLGATRYIQKPLNFEEFLKIGSVLKDLLATSAG